MAQQNRTIGILVSNILNPFQAALTKAIDAAGRAGQVARAIGALVLGAGLFLIARAAGLG